MNGLKNWDDRKAFMRNGFFRHVPDAGNVFAMLRIFNIAPARKLVTFLSLLATALAVTLAGDHRVAASFATDSSRGHHQIDRRHAVQHAFGVVLNATRV